MGDIIVIVTQVRNKNNSFSPFKRACKYVEIGFIALQESRELEFLYKLCVWLMETTIYILTIIVLCNMTFIFYGLKYGVAYGMIDNLLFVTVIGYRNESGLWKSMKWKAEMEG